MITALTAIAIAFAWLLRETAGLTVRLPVGPEPALQPERELKYVSWTEAKAEIENMTYSHQPFWHKHPSCMVPLCGWDWLKNREHIVPEYEIHLRLNGNRYDMTVEAQAIPATATQQSNTEAGLRLWST